ncbi:Phospholipid:diacylglycerol acyltransferase [Neolecta irregularis DAH-3]|uniref:Phospholipid:diacylglycerol acyltransferase n=1 Tax=Neolecta irregularis (strain DAH-3) TaxID=1198029 RepID=A0A1U7LHR0_NEOID|nr:Phospholipid:diacylglycerol acyltransferase [Neolecta irregularis DAH-3]|eukprot:OLL22184.1 Phospholipid:diacylglycerol acyltransferase [Neolecta irregularis DAH-3]
MHSAAYDWRISYTNLEERGKFQYWADSWLIIRDHYFSKLKVRITMQSLTDIPQMIIESSNSHTGKKTVLVAHSMGSLIVLWFMKWVEAEGYGNGGSTWINDNIEAFINVWSLLGTPKAFPVLLSGEMRDTAQLNAISVYGLEKFFSKSERATLMRSLPGISSMLPKGGDIISWGDGVSAPDDLDNEGNQNMGAFLKFAGKRGTDGVVKQTNLTISESFEYLFKHTPDTFHKLLKSNFSYGIARTEEQLIENDKRPEKWSNPLEFRLPYAPDLKIYCLYGVGKLTERSYWYKEEVLIGSNISIPVIDNTINVKAHTEKGVETGEGDGTVPLISSGYMCVKGWKNSLFNPGNATVTTYEMEHMPGRFDFRGGPHTSDHVDILGRTELIELILKIAAGKHEDIKDNIVSSIREIADRINL